MGKINQKKKNIPER